LLLNISAGEFSIFVTPAFGVGAGASVGLTGGFFGIRKLPSNGRYAGVAETLGGLLQASEKPIVIGADGFWAPLTDSYNPLDVAHGGGIDVGIGVGIGAYLQLAYAVELVRYNKDGVYYPRLPGPRQIYNDIYRAIQHDLIPILQRTLGQGGPFAR
jgi:hypothetical protein